MTSNRLVSLLRDLGCPRVGVVGDLMLDEYVWGDVERISPEAPIPVLHVSRRQYRAGGAGSVIVNLVRLGAEVSVFGLLGRDRAGELVQEVFRKEGCRLEGLLFDEGRQTTVKSRHLGFVQQAHRGVQQILRVDDEVQQPIDDAVVGRLLDALRRAARELDVLLVSDYSKGLIRNDLMQSLLEIAGSEVPVLVDPARLDDYSRYRGAFLICPNRYEAEGASGIPCREIEGCRRAGTKLLEELDVRVVAMTLDREGILLCEKGRRPRHIPTRARVVADVTGAGDMVLGVLGLVTAAGGTQEEAAQLANVAAGMEVRHLGVTPIAREELLQELRYEGHPAASKVKSLDELLEAVGEGRRDGKSVVFTNGCFDLLHVGHHQLLHEARKEGDVLIVAVNGDGSIRRLKGPTRPSLSQEYRVLMLAGLEAVDYVIVFDEDTPNHLLETIRPDVLVKGSEYREGTVVGREIVEGYGGRIAFVEQVPGVSTTALLGETPRSRK